jgi:hypothetical protein
VPVAMIFVARQRIPDEPSCTAFYQRLVEPKQNPEPKLRALRGSYADTTIATYIFRVAHSKTISKQRSYDSNRYFALVNPPVVLVCPASDDSDIQLRECSIGGITDVTCKVGSGRAAYTCLV